MFCIKGKNSNSYVRLPSIVFVSYSIIFCVINNYGISSADETASGMPVPFNGHVSGYWTNDSQAIYLSDMTRCEPSTALASGLSKGRWKVIPYETVDGMVGKMVWASPNTGAPELSLPLPVEGWYAIYLGVFSSPAAYSKLWFKLDTDPAAVPRQNNLTSFDDNGSAEEIFFKAAHLQNNSLIIRQNNGSCLTSGGIVYVKLIPLTENEITFLLNDRNDRSHKTLVLKHDTEAVNMYNGYQTEEHILSAIEVLRDTDFGTIIIELSYPGVFDFHGDMRTRDDADYAMVESKVLHESIKVLESKNIDPVKVLIDGAHNIGIKAVVAVRPGFWGFWHEPFAGQESPFYKNNPQWRCVDRDGTIVERMSWAVPEVRKHVIDCLVNAVALGADGAHILFNRGYPLALYEKPAVDMFMKKYGEDPRTIDESDPRIVELWSDIITTFFRELRARLDEEEARRGDGKRIEISATVLGNGEFNLQYGVDVERLASEGLIDTVYPFKWNWGAVKFGIWDFTHGVFQKKYDSITYKLDYFKNACGKYNVPFKPYFWGIPDIKDRLTEAVGYYESGASGLAAWDAGYNCFDMHDWFILTRMGHIEETKVRSQSELPPKIYKRFHRLGTHIMDGRFPVNWGG